METRKIEIYLLTLQNNKNMDKIINTKFDNLVNYTTNKSSADSSQNCHYNSVDPTSLASFSKNNQLIEYRLAIVSEKEIMENEITEPNSVYKKQTNIK